MDDNDLDPGLEGALRDRLARLEAAAPAAAPPLMPFPAPRTHKLRGLGLALAAVLLVGAATAAGTTVLNNARGHEGLFNPGQPLACTGVERMTPPEAADWFAQHGYTQAEIGQLLGVPAGTVGSWLSRSKAQLRELLKETS